MNNPINSRKGIVRAFLAVSFSIIGFNQIIFQKEIPTWYIALWGSIVSFFFGGEIGSQKPET